MTEVKGRKKHTVNGEVKEIKKGEEGLGLGQIGEISTKWSFHFRIQNYRLHRFDACEHVLAWR